MKKEHTHLGPLRLVTACIAIVGVVATLLASDAIAQQDCGSIEDDASRLACYDSQALPPKPVEAPPPEDSPPSKPVEAPVPMEATQPAPLDEEIGKEALGREEDEELVVHGTVVRCVEDATSKYLFYFDNGQIWKQKDNTTIRWKECAFDVTITKDFFGYKMIPVGEKRKVRIGRVK